MYLQFDNIYVCVKTFMVISGYIYGFYISKTFYIILLTYLYVPT